MSEPSEQGIVLIGVDPSSRKIAMCITTNENTLDPGMVTKNLTPQKPVIACSEAYNYAYEFVRNISKHGEVHVFVEAPLSARGGVKALLPQARVNGALLAGFSDGGARVYDANVMTVKKEVVGKGNVGKPAMKSWLAQHWGVAHKKANNDQDLIDASIINRYGAKVLSRMNVIQKSGTSKARIRRAPKKKIRSTP